jgi:hypothetical protein
MPLKLLAHLRVFIQLPIIDADCHASCNQFASLKL